MTSVKITATLEMLRYQMEHKVQNGLQKQCSIVLIQESILDTPVKMNFFLLIFCVLLWNSVQAKLDIMFDDAECKDTDDEYIAPDSCQIEVNDDSQYGSSLTTHMEMIKQVPDNARIVAKVYGITMGEYTNDIGFDVDIDLCEISEERYSITKPFIKAFGLVGSACPPEPGVYGMENFVIDPDDGLPYSFPVGKYLITISLLIDERTIITINVYLAVA